MTHPLWAHVLLLDPTRIERKLALVRESGIVRRTPNTWQIALGMLRMLHRVTLRSETVGTSSTAPVRGTWRARAMSWRPLRFPFLLAERAVAPLDLSGLLSSRERVVRHLLGAHHDRHQFVYDLELLRVEPGALDELLVRATAVVNDTDPRAEWLRDLVVFDGYHENLLAAVERACAGDFGVPGADAQNPDVTFAAYLDWCAAQPETPEATWKAVRSGLFAFPGGLATALTIHASDRARSHTPRGR
jgi:hypothetical protein